MAKPKTLMEMAGGEPRPHELGSSALLLVDFQNEYLSGRLALPAACEALAEAERLLQAAREVGAPVFHVQHKGNTGGLFDPKSPAFAIAEGLTPLADETIIIKSLPNAFSGTDLEARLRETEARTLIVAGFMTHMCVSSTVRAALDHGFGCTVVASACATRDLPDASGGVLPAETVHRVELAALADRFCVVAPDAASV